MERVKNEVRQTYQDKLQTIIGQKGVTSFADSIGVRRDTVNNWISGKSDIRLNDLVTISKRYNVSVDYLLGLSDNESPDTSIQGASNITGLSNDSINILHNISQLSAHPISVLDMLIADLAYNTSEDRKDILSQIYSLFTFNGLKVSYKIVNGEIVIDENPQIIRDREIKLTEEKMLDLILEGIKRSLLRIRDNMKKEGEE